MKQFHSVLLTTCAVFLASCNSGGLRGNGNVVTEERSAMPFVNVEAEGAFQIEWQPGAPAVAVTTDENLQRYVTTNISGGILHLRTTRSLRPHVKVTIASSALEGAELNGASRLTARGLGGAKFYLESNGAAKIVADGAVDELIATMNGASNFEGEHLRAKTATLELNGAGKAVVAVSDSLDVSIAGAGKVEYIGNPARLRREVAGAGSIRRRE
ncbi:MAG: DUF2807 domain-containing protein [Verrucomicrobiota bacterium]